MVVMSSVIELYEHNSKQNMQDVWSLPLACLLVCQSAIFIGSKKG